MTVHLLLWSLADADTTLGELRGHLPPLAPPSVWISDESTGRFGLVAFGDPPDLARIVELIGKDPDLADELDVEEAR